MSISETLEDLNRNELRRFASHANLLDRINGRTDTNEQLRASLAKHATVEMVQAWRDSEETEATLPTPTATPEGDVGSQLADLIARIGSTTPSADLEQRIANLERKVADRPTKTEQVIVSPKGTVKVDGYTHREFPKVVAAVGAGLNVWLYGPPGTGKSSMAAQVAESLGLESVVESFHALMGAHDLKGFTDAHGRPHRSTFQDAYVNGKVYIADELDNANPSLTTWMNQATAGNRANFADGMHDRHEDFRIIVCANTNGTGGGSVHAGVNRLNSATLDRYAQIEVRPDFTLEEDLALQRANSVGITDKDAKRIVTLVHKGRTECEQQGIKAHGYGMRMILDVITLVSTGQFTINAAVASKTTVTKS